ncbi:MAG: bifunctional DNA primase/polymerase [Actinomycetota bacterium]
MSQLLEAALEYARKGWPVFPCRLVNGKKVPWLDHAARDCPQGEGNCGYKHATCDEQTIRQWWTTKPDAWIGVNCEGARWAVVDVDPRNGGVRPAAADPTLLQETMSGGEHLIYLAEPNRRYPGTLGPGVDVKHRGYVIVAPSPGYRWKHEVDPVPFPPALLGGSGGHVGGSGGQYKPDPELEWAGIPEGQRHDKLFGRAAELRGRGGVSREEAVAILEKIARKAGCADPEKEAEGFVDDAWRRYEDGGSPEQRAAARWFAEDEEAEEGEGDEREEPEVEEDWPVMEEAAFHGIAGEVVDLLLPATEADRVALLVEFLVAWGNLLGTGPHLRLSGAQHPARLFGCLVGDTARARKSAAWSCLKQVFYLVDQDWLTRQVGGDGLSSGEGLIVAVRDPITRRGQNGREYTDEGVPDKRLLIHDPEFAGKTLTLMRREGSILSAVVRECYDTGNLLNRKSEQIRATNAHVSIMGHCTLEELGSKLTDVEIANGFANRFLFFLVRRSKNLHVGGHPDPDALAELARKLSALYQAALRTGQVGYDHFGDRAWKKSYDRMMDSPTTGPLDALTARTSIHAQRLQLLYATLNGSEAIGAQEVESSLAVVRYAYLSARRLLNAKGSTGNRDADALLELLHREGILSVRDAMQKLGWTSGAKMSRARGFLERNRLIKTEPGRGGKILMRAY